MYNKEDIYFWEKKMKIAVIATTSGAGSTFISTNLSYVSGYTYLDCSLNQIGHTFFEREKTEDLPLNLQTVELTEKDCGECASCLSLCKKNAFIKTEEYAKLVCKACPEGDCTVACHNNLTKTNISNIGNLITEKSGKLKLARLNCEHHNVALAFECALKHLENENLVVDLQDYTAPFALPIMKACDYCIIVVEPGASDFENFKALVRLCKLANKPFGLVINKLITPYDKLVDYCNLHSTDVLARIPCTARESKIIQSGQIISAVKFSYKQYFTEVIHQIKKKLK